MDFKIQDIFEHKIKVMKAHDTFDFAFSPE